MNISSTTKPATAKGAAGIDDQSIEDFDKRLKSNLYKVWNRMSSGSYFPPPVRTVKIPKKNGGEKKLGISEGGANTTGDTIARRFTHHARTGPRSGPVGQAETHRPVAACYFAL
jgi:hypothetical protein